VEKFHNSPPVDPVVSITAPEIKKRLGSWVRCSISVLVIGGMATANIVFASSSDALYFVDWSHAASHTSSLQSSDDVENMNIQKEDSVDADDAKLLATKDPILAALKEYGYEVTKFSDKSAFENTLATEKDWGIVVLMKQNWWSGDFPNLRAYISDGGKAIIADWTRDQTLGSAFDINYTGNNNQRPVTIKDPLLATDLPNPLSLINPGWGIFSMGMSTSTGKVLATFPNGDAAVVMGNEDNTIAVGFLNDTIPTNENAQLFYKNLIGLFNQSGGPGKFEFTSKIYFANENAKNAIVKVVRKGGSNGVVSVNYATAAFEDRDTVDPTSDPASEGEDYATTEGTLTWKDGETGIQTFKVPVFDDQDEEGDETVQLVLSSPNGAALGDKKKISAKLRIADDECHGVYTTAARTLYHPLITVPVFDPITGQATQDIQVFEGTFSLLNGTEDFIIDVTDEEQFNFVKNIKNVDKLKADCYAKYDWQTETFQIPYVDTPSIVVLPMGKSRVGPTQIFRAKMQQMPLSGEYEIGNYIFHVEGAPFQDSSITADANASVKTESKDEVEAEVDASIEIAPDELTYYQYLYTYDK